MKRTYILLTICAWLLPFIVSGQYAISEKIQQNVSTIQQTAKYTPLTEIVGKSANLPNIPEAVLSQKQFFQLQNQTVKSILNQKSKYLQMTLPIEGQNVELQLLKADIFTDDFRVVAASNPDEDLDLDLGTHYWGTVEGAEESLVTISFFEGEIAGTINFDNNQYTLGKVGGSEYHILYEPKNLNFNPDFSCTAIPGNDGENIEIDEEGVSQNSAFAPCVRIHIEFDYNLFQQLGGTQNSTNYMNGVFAEVASLYANENMTIQISYLRIWDTPSPYGSGDGLDALTAQGYGRTYGDLVHLVRADYGGGVAYLNQLCGSSVNTGSSGVFGNYQNVPTYSWDVNVIAHELGHNFGSPHTHACSWSGGAIDGCGPAAGYSEGCNGPLPSNGGTIMSYCHILNNVGVNFNLGFGTQPGNLMRSRYNNASCLEDCGSGGGGPTCDDGIQNGNETAVDCGGPDCPACPPEVCSPYNFNNSSIIGYDAGQDFGPAVIQDGGATVFMNGNAWKALQINYTVTPNTIIEFDFRSTIEGEIHEVSFDNDLLLEPNHRMVIYGNQGYAGTLNNPTYTGNGNWQSFTVAIGAQFTGTFTYLVLTADDDANSTGNSYFRNINIYQDYNGNGACDSASSCNDGIQNGNETGIDCGGSCPPCPTCNDGIQNGNETGVDCGGSCPACPTCFDGIQNGNETGVDCGGSCPACPTCFDGIQNGNETGVDCGGNCPACPPEVCSPYNFNNNPIIGYDVGQDFGPAIIQDGGATVFMNGNAWKALQINYTVAANTIIEFDFRSTIEGEIHEVGFDNDLILEPNHRMVIYGNQGYGGTLTNPTYNGNGNWQSFSVNIGAQFTGTYTYLVLTADDDANSAGNSYFRNIKIYNDNNGNGTCDSVSSCNDGIQNGNETGVDCGGSCPACPTCNDSIQNGNETGVDCGGPDCPACPTCNDGIQNGNETGVDCGGNCPACPTCFDGIQNGNETGVDCGGNCPACPSEVCAPYDFNTNPIIGYDAGQDFGPAVIQDGGATVFMDGNAWKALQINYTVTANTVIEFDFRSTIEGEIHEVGFDNDLILAPNHRMVIYGNQGYPGTLTNPVYTGNGNWQSFALNIGAQFTGTFTYIVLTADDDANAAGNSYFRNIKIYEDNDGNLQCDDSPCDGGEVTAPCVNGFAGGYPCNNIDLVGFLSLNQMGCSGANDIWGWTDPQTGKEYAIFGCTDRTTFIDISTPTNPVLIGTLLTNTSAVQWRDIKVFNNHAFIVSEAGGHGMQVFNLTRLRNVNSPVNFNADAVMTNLGSGLTLSNSHNIVLNEQSGYVYTVGSNTCSGGLTAINVNNPTSPTFAGCFSSDGYTHDAQCVNYIGPDGQYAGREICFNSNENTLTIVDVTNKSDMSQISRTGYAGQRYTHQGWLTDNHEYFLMNDELDESQNGHNTRTHIWDVRNLDSPVYRGFYQATVGSIDHNLYIKGNKAYMANYRSGLRILDISNIANADLQEVAYFDTYPQNDAASFNSAWSNYPYFASGNIIVSDIEQGLFILRDNTEGQGCLEIELYAYLEGPIDNETGQMTSTLNSRGLLPGQTPASNLITPTPAGQPYNVEPWNYTGTEGANWTDANYTGDEVDWILVSFRTGVEKTTEVGRVAALLKRDGSVEFPTGTSSLSNTLTGSVYVVLQHRNHIGVMTAQPVSIVGNRLVHDFRAADSYRDATSVGQKEGPSGGWCMFAGDASQMDFPSYDINLTDKTEWTDGNGVFDYYASPDFNMDGDINGDDKTFWEDNNGFSSRVPK